MIWWLFLLEKSVDFYPAPSLSWRNQRSNDRCTSKFRLLPIPHHSILYFARQTMPTSYTLSILSKYRTSHFKCLGFWIQDRQHAKMPLITSLPVSRIGPLCWTWAWWTVNKCCGTGSVLAVLMRCDETPRFMRAITLIYWICQNIICEYTWTHCQNLVNRLRKNVLRHYSDALKDTTTVNSDYTDSTWTCKLPAQAFKSCTVRKFLWSESKRTEKNIDKICTRKPAVVGEGRGHRAPKTAKSPKNEANLHWIMLEGPDYFMNFILRIPWNQPSCCNFKNDTPLKAMEN